MKYKQKKFSLFLLLIAFLIVPVLNLQASTIVNSNITKNTTWDTKGSPYIISATIEVISGSKLTINPDVVVQFDYGTEIDVSGSVLINGKAGDDSDKKVYVTSIADTTLTKNKDDKRRPSTPPTTPAPGDYNGFVFNNGSTGVLKNIQIRYANAAIVATNANLSISNSSFSNNNSGVEVNGGNLALNSSSFSNNDQPLMVDFSTQFTHDSNRFSSNSYNGIGLTGDSTGLNYSFTADAPYVLFTNSNVSSGKTFSLSKGATLLSGSSNSSVALAGGTISTTVTSGRDSEGRDDSNSIVTFDGVSIQAFNSSVVNLKNIKIKNTTGAAITVWDSAVLNADSITIDSISGDGIVAFSNATINLKNSTISNFGSSGAGLTLFNDAKAIIQKSIIDTGGDGIVAFNHAGVDADHLTIKNCTDGGIISFTNDGYSDTNIKLRYSTITANGFGMYPISHTAVDIFNNSIFGNNVGIIANNGSSYNFANNWWGDASGPYNAIINSTGTGNEVYDGVIVSPWLKRDPLSSRSSDEHGFEHGRRHYSDSERENMEHRIKDRMMKVEKEHRKDR